MKNLLRYVTGGLAALLFFCNVPVWNGHTGLFELRVAEAAYNPAWITNVDSANLLVSGNWSNYPYVNLTSYVLGKNKGGGLVALNSTDTTSAQNACTIFVDAAGNRFYRELTGSLTVFQCGALGDGVANDTAAEQNGINTIIAAGVVNTIQGAPGGKLVWPPGTFVTTTTLNFGSLVTDNNLGIWLHGPGRGAAVIAGNVAGPVIAAYSTIASTKISDLFITNNNASNINSCIDVRGNGLVMDDLWFNCLTGVAFNGATDVQAHHLLCDQCQSSLLAFSNLVGLSNGINISDVEIFGGVQTNTFGIICTGAHFDITISGVQMTTMTGGGLQLNSGCNMNFSDYALDGFGNASSHADHRGISVTDSKLNLGVGTITGWGESCIFANGASTVTDTGSVSSNCVLSNSATNKFPLSVIGANYFKSGGSIAGGSGKESDLVLINGSNNGNLTLNGVFLQSSNGGAVFALNGASAITSVVLTGNTMTLLNTGNSAANTPITLGAVTTAQINENTITTSNAVTSAVTYNSGTVNLTNNLSHSGTFPATAGNLVSTNNRNF